MWVAFLGTPFLNGNDGKMEKIFRIYKHPFYNVYSLDYDVALLELSSPVRFSSTIKPICLPDNSHVFQEGARCFITGWGSTKEGGTASPPGHCRPHYASHLTAPKIPHNPHSAGDASAPHRLTNNSTKGPSCAPSAGEEPGLGHLPSAGLSLWHMIKATATPLLHHAGIIVCSAPS